MNPVNSHKSNENYFNISIEATNLIENEYNNDNIIYAIEEISNEYSTNKYPVLTQTMNELFIIYENNKEFIINYYSKIDKPHNSYLLKEINNINELNKTGRIFTFLKNYANYNDDKRLKALLNKKKIE